MKQQITLPLLMLTTFTAGILVERLILDTESAGTSEVRLPVSIFSVPDPGSAIEGRTGTPGESEAVDRRSKRSESEPQDAGKQDSLTELLALEEEEAMHDALDGYSSSDVVVLLEKLRESGDDSRNARNLKRALYQRWAHNAPREALAKVLGESDARLKLDVLHTAFAELAERDLSQATASFTDLTTHRQRQEAVEAMAHHIGVEEMGALASFLADNASNVEVEGLYHRWAELDPGSTTMQELAAAQGPEALRAAARGYASSDPHNALTWAREIDQSFPGTRALLSALESLIDVDPREAAAWLGQLPPGQQHDAAREIAHRWAREDLGDALTWTDTLEGFAQRAALDGLTNEWALQDPRAAAQFAQSLPPSEQRRDTLAEIAHLWARDDVNAALDWAHSLPDQESVRALQGVMSTVADQNPEAAAELVSRMSGAVEPRAYREVAGEVAGEWTEFDPASAASWAQSLELEGNVRHEAIERVADRWIQQDPMSASQWIGTLPAGQVRDAAAERLVDHVASYDPAAAYEWALTAGSVDHQTSMLEHVFRQWEQLDPQAARNTLNAAPINPDQRRELGQIFERPGSP